MFSRIAALAALTVLSLVLSSCTSTDVYRAEDYIGALKERAAAPAPPAGPVSAPQTASKVETAGPLQLTINDTVLITLKNNRALVVDRYNTPIFRTAETFQKAVFDPDFFAGYAFSHAAVSQPVVATSTSNEFQVGITQFLPTGTTLAATLMPLVVEPPVVPAGPTAATTGQLSVTQALLRGYGTDVNLANVREAKIDTLSSQYNLRGFTEALVAQVEEAYWNYCLDQRQIEIFQQSLKIAEQQLHETQERIRVGALAPTEAAAAEAEVASRHEDLINASAALETARVTLLQLLNPPGPNPLGREIVVLDLPIVPDVVLDNVADHVEAAEKFRADLNQARLQANRGDLEVVKTKNGLLPKLDVFVSLGDTGYSRIFAQSFGRMNDHNYDLMAGLSYEEPIGNRAAKATYEHAVLSRDQAIESVGNLALLVEQDARNAYIELHRAKEEVAASAVTLKFRQESLRAEKAKFDNGKSTSLLVAQAERDLLQAQITQVQAQVTYLKDFVELYRLTGTLLQRRGIVAPGAETVTMNTLRPASVAR
jgi:outer membrane protein TolC